MAICALCGKDTELRDSHIVPKFIIRYLKNTSPGKIRNLAVPNRAVEDGEKHKLLCSDCEERFSACEKYFADTVFYPYKNDHADTFLYDEKLFFFLTSLAWRSLYLDSQDESYSEEARQEMERNIEGIRQYLLGNAAIPANVENHLFFFDTVVGSNLAEEDHNHPNATVHRSITSYTVESGDGQSIFVFSNMLGIIAVMFIKKATYENWVGTTILNGSGTVVARNQEVQSIVGNEFTRMMQYRDEAFSTISEQQHQKIQTRLQALGEKIRDYAIFQDWESDRKMAQTPRKTKHQKDGVRWILKKLFKI